MINSSHYSILLVEDDSNDVFLIQRAFRRAQIVNYIHVVQDGDEAVEYFEGQGKYRDRNAYPLPNLVLLDLKLPRRSGLEVLEWLKKQPIFKKIPVVVLTSSQEHIDLERAYEIGVNSYLIKPVTFDALVSMIEATNTYWFKLNQFAPIYLV
jgi:CheY-like chemotaxis protein